MIGGLIFIGVFYANEIIICYGARNDNFSLIITRNSWVDDLQKNFYLQYIIADHLPFEFGGRQYYLTTPSREARFLAERRFISVYAEAVKEGLLQEGDINKLLYEKNIWSDEKEKTLNKLINGIDDIKVQIFESYTNTTQKRNYKKALRDTEEYIAKMLVDKNAFEAYSARSAANFCKQHFLMGSSVYVSSSRKPLFKNQWFINSDDSIVQFSYTVSTDYILNESEYRELSRSNQWRNIWSARRGNGSLFGKATVDLSAAQRQLTLFSSMYDNVFKNSECPTDEIVEDDDALDGWMIKQRRIRNKETNKQLIEGSITNEKIRNSGQIYVISSPEDAHKVYDCNDLQGKIRIRNIMNQIQKEGAVNIMDLKDTKSELLRKANELMGAR